MNKSEFWGNSIKIVIIIFLQFVGYHLLYSQTTKFDINLFSTPEGF